MMKPLHIITIMCFCGVIFYSCQKHILEIREWSPEVVTPLINATVTIGDLIPQRGTTEYDDNNFTQYGKNIIDLKERYNAYKYTMGIEIKLLGYSFYSYPTALTYEYHVPLSDPWDNKGKQYLKILFDFN